MHPTTRYTQEIASSTCEYGLIPKEEWNQPDWWVVPLFARGQMLTSPAPPSLAQDRRGEGDGSARADGQRQRDLRRQRPLSQQCVLSCLSAALAPLVLTHMLVSRSVCRFNSGFFYRQPLMMKYRYYWRIEPSVKFFCDIRYDPFLVMMDEKKVYGQLHSLFSVHHLALIPSELDLEGFTLSLFEFTE